MSIAADLRELGVDSPELREKASRQYIRKLERQTTLAVQRVWLLVTAADWAGENALRRGDYPGYPRDRDWLEAFARVQREYGDASRDYVIAELRPDLAARAQ